MSVKPITLFLPLLLSACAAGTLSPTGPHAVGTTTWVAEHPGDLADPLPPKEGVRRVPAQAWYPAAGDPGALSEEAALSELNAPVLLFLHGGGSERAMHTSLFHDLASHGYVAISMDHPGIARKARYPDQGNVGLHDDFVASMDSGNTLITAAQPLYPELVDLMRADAALALDTLPLLLEGIDTGTMAVGGHSLGGDVALDFCREDARCAVLVNLDGPPLGDQVGVNDAGEAILEARGLDLPAIVVSTGLYVGRVPGAAGAWEALDDQAQVIDGPVLHWHMEEAGHLDVTDVPLVMPTGLARLLFGEESIGRLDPEDTVGASTEAIRTFLDQHLACDPEALPAEVGEGWPILDLRNSHEDRRESNENDACP